MRPGSARTIDDQASTGLMRFADQFEIEQSIFVSSGFVEIQPSDHYIGRNRDALGGS